MTNKRGELTSKQLIGIIILIISFSIILIFFFSLGLKSTIDKEACKQSVVMKGTLPAGTNIELKCKVQKVCLSLGDKCDSLDKELETIKVKDNTELIQKMSELLYDCWWMMGEGQIDYMSSGLGFNEAYCTLCNQVFFDKKVQEKYPEGIPYQEIYSYMKSNKIPNKEKPETYLYYFYKLNDLTEVKNKLQEEYKLNIFEYKLDPKKQYVVLTALIKEGWGKYLISAGSGAVAGWPLGPVGIIGGAGVGLFVASTTDPGVKFMIPMYVEYDVKSLEETINCKEYVSEI